MIEFSTFLCNLSFPNKTNSFERVPTWIQNRYLMHKQLRASKMKKKICSMYVLIYYYGICGEYKKNHRMKSGQIDLHSMPHWTEVFLCRSLVLSYRLLCLHATGCVFATLGSCQTIELSDYRTFGLSGRRTIGPSDYRAFGLFDLRSTGPSD